MTTTKQLTEITSESQRYATLLLLLELTHALPLYSHWWTVGQVRSQRAGWTSAGHGVSHDGVECKVRDARTMRSRYRYFMITESLRCRRAISTSCVT